MNAQLDPIMDIVRSVLLQECGIESEKVLRDAHLIDDLGADSLDLLNASFRLEKELGVKIPVQAWLAAEYGDEPPAQSPFSVGQLCDFLAAATA